MTLSLTYECRPDSNFPLSKREVTHMAELLLNALKIDGFDFDLKITDDSAIAVINHDFLGCVGPTNVLSFPFSETPDITKNKYLGEIVLSVDTLARETRLYGQVPEDHLVRLLAHALLHLAGYDHGQEMYSLTDVAVETVAPIFRQRIVGWH
ncbi:probable rRNA maturation factor [Maridesulfovibrio ferrireducens]|uniref:Endoribonuclease YbeY n=1 Tax=Maridesulfovibrio ferrireducens TaxID=246191 RepID=A0A1G9HVX2_9BACT|nr:rRNA maturation RNase YbeY [Maridesulfovibrio ferrireducens]SDL17002.1 probable rRNA maturation factor [Maridesulfovibrio ferrireducens]